MIDILTDEHKRRYRDFSDFVDTNVVPLASAWDRDQAVPKNIIALLGKSGFLGCIIPKEFEGNGWDCITFGLLNEAFGRGSSSLTSLFTVQAMVAMTLVKWGTNQQRKQWLSPMARGEILGAFALTEPGTGSNLQAIETTFIRKGNTYLLNGVKKWITFSDVADLFLVFGKLEGKPLACLVKKEDPGVKISPIKEMLGFRACHIAQINFNEVEVSEESIIGKPGFGLSHIAPYGLHYGRLSTAWSSVGLLRACLEESTTYASNRKVSDTILGDRGMIRQMITHMGVDLEAARLLCLQASMLTDQHLPEAIEKALVAKYFSSRAVTRAASDAVQIHGALGCNEESSVARYYRDAKIMEIIEGSTQVYQDILGKSFIEEFKQRDT